MAWLEQKKGITAEDVKQYRIGYVGHRWLKDKLEGKSKAVALKVGLLKEKDNKIYDTFWKRLIIPVWSRGKIVSIWTRKFPDDGDKSFKWLGLPNSELIPNKPIAFGENLNCETCVVTESISDAIAFLKAGIPACTPIGTKISQENRAYFEKARAKLYFAFDPDGPGKEASYELSKEFKGHILNLGYGKDPDEVLAELGPEVFKKVVEKAIEEARYCLDLVIEKENKIEVLKEIAKLELVSDQENYLRKYKEKTGNTLEALKEDLKRVQRKIEDEKFAQAAQGAEKISEPPNPLNEYTEEEKIKAEEILKSLGILSGVISITEKAGYVGEEKNKKLAYLACTSRKLPGKKKAISLTPKGESGSGKSELVKHILKLIPSRDWKEFTFITEKALLHTKENLSHKILCVFERQGGETANYPIRTAQSEEKLSIFIPVKDPTTGDFQSIEKTIPAEGMVYIETTTEEHIEPQNANRTFEFFTDSSPEQTREVLRAQARTHILNEDRLEKEYRVWRCTQDLLEPLPVYIPYASELTEQFPADRVRARRDYPRLLALIEALAFLHQNNRERKEMDGETFIVASTQDFEVAYDIIRPILSQTYKDLSPKEESLILIFKEEYGIGCFADQANSEGKDQNIFSPKELLEKIEARCTKKEDKTARGFGSYSTLKRYLTKLTKKGLLEWNEGKGIKSKYVLISDIPSVTFQIFVSQWANTQKSESFLGETLAQCEVSQYRANEPISDELAQDKAIGSPLAQNGLSQSSSYESLDNLGIGSLAKQDMDGKGETTSDRWEEEAEEFLGKRGGS